MDFYHMENCEALTDCWRFFCGFSYVFSANGANENNINSDTS